MVKRHFYLNARRIADNLRRWAKKNKSIKRLRADIVGVRSSRPIDIGGEMLDALEKHREAVERARSRKAKNK